MRALVRLYLIISIIPIFGRLKVKSVCEGSYIHQTHSRLFIAGIAQPYSSASTYMYGVLGILNAPEKRSRGNENLFVTDRISNKSVRLAQFVIRPHCLKSVGSNSGQVMFYLAKMFSTSVPRLVNKLPGW